jgi:hypothetical protein
VIPDADCKQAISLFKNPTSALLQMRVGQIAVQLGVKVIASVDDRKLEYVTNKLGSPVASTIKRRRLSMP